jgi:hypothetical protein
LAGDRHTLDHPRRRILLCDRGPAEIEDEDEDEDEDEVRIRFVRHEER